MARVAPEASEAAWTDIVDPLAASPNGSLSSAPVELSSSTVVALAQVVPERMLPGNERHAGRQCSIAMTVVALEGPGLVTRTQ